MPPPCCIIAVSFMLLASTHLPLDAGAAQSKPRGIQNQRERFRLWIGLLSYLSLMQLFESVSDWWLIQISDWNIPSTDPGLGDPPWHHHIRSKPKCCRKCKWTPYILLSHTMKFILFSALIFGVFFNPAFKSLVILVSSDCCYAILLSINYTVYICKDLQLEYFFPADPMCDLSVTFSYFLFIIAAVWHGNIFKVLWETDTLVFCTDNIW